ncbi:MAG: tape measure protein [Bacteroidaceae bacterium]|nr:tape measure protein [Bacteroidaceae bacterium]
MATGGNNVSLSLNMRDNVSSKLEKIVKNMDKVIDTATKYNALLEKIAENSKAINTKFGRFPSGNGVMSPTFRGTAKSTSNSDLTGLQRSIGTTKTAIDGLLVTQKKLNSEFSKMPSFVQLDTTAMQSSLGKVTTSLSNVLKAQDEFVTSAHSMGLNTMSNETLTAMRATENAIDSVTLAYKRFEDARAKGKNPNVEELKGAYNELASALTNVKTLQSQINNVMKNADLPTEDVTKLKTVYSSLDDAVNRLTTHQLELNRATNKSISNPKLYSYTTTEVRKLDSAIDALINTHDHLQKETKESSVEMDKLQKELSETTTGTKSASNGLEGLTSTLKRIGGAYLGIETLKTAFDWSDQLTLTEGKLTQLTDDVEGFMSKAYQMSQDTRTSYMDNAAQMAKMWQLTGGTDGIFETEDKLIEFNELLNKSFILGGSGTREINASLYQLTQALSSGRLQGDELRSLGENAPYLINTITDSILEMYNEGKSESEKLTKLTYNDLKRLGAEGVLTSELVTNAVLNSADKIRDAYKNVKPTWEQTFQTLKNQVQKISEPILRTLNDLINSEAFEKTVQTLVKIFSVAMALLTPILKGIMAIGEVISDNWGLVEPIIWGIVGALGVYLGYLALAKVYTFALGFAQGFQLIMSKGVGYSMVENTRALAIYNGYTKIATMWSKMLGAAKMFLAGATWSAVVAEYGLLAPLLLIIAVIGAVIGAIYLIVYAYNKWTDSTVSATGIIIGAFYVLYAYVYNVIAMMWNEIVEFAEFIANIFNDPIYTLKKLFGDMAISVIDIWLGMNNGMIDIVNSVKDTINGLLSYVNDGINSVIDVYNSTLGTMFGKANKVNFELTTDQWDATAKKLEGWKTSINEWVGEPNKTPINYDDKKMEYKDLGEYWDKGYSKGEKWESDIAGMFNTDKLLEGLDTDYSSNIPGIDNWLDSNEKYDPTNVGGDNTLGDAERVLDEINANTDEIADMGKEELKYLKDIAEQKVINKFTLAEIKFTNNMTNNISSDRDLDGMTNQLCEMLEKACETSAERVNFTG